MMNQRPETSQLTSHQQRHLLALARQTAGDLLARRPLFRITKPTVHGQFGGAFTTFWRASALRGCVGSLVTTVCLEQTVQDVTGSSLRDPRFAATPISPLELTELRIEISVLSQLQRTFSPAELVPGTHGIVVRRAGRSGCFLPKVATEHGWSPESFLDACCKLKAHLPPNAWREPNTETYLFTVDSFAENPTGRTVGNK